MPDRCLRIVFVGLALAIATPRLLAQHLDVLVEDVAGRLTTGATDFNVTPAAATLGTRVYQRTFDAAYAVNNPGFNSIGSTAGTPPAGSAVLPGSRDLAWDFLPLKVGTTTAGLLYWNGAGAVAADVAFGLPPTLDYSLSLFGKNGFRASSSAAAVLVPGGVIDTTATDGFIHSHRYFFLDNDRNDANATVAAAGVYLVALRLRMDGLDRSAPFAIVWGTPTTSTTAVSAAAAWVQSRLDNLAPDFAADFNGDLAVNGLDLAAWSAGFGNSDAAALQINGDANFNDAIDGTDFLAWQRQQGTSVESWPGASPGSAIAARAINSVPEPPAGVLAAILALAGISCARTKRLFSRGRREC